jgi:hypothetical protein
MIADNPSKLHCAGNQGHIGLIVPVSPHYSTREQLEEFDEIWYELYAIGIYPKITLTPKLSMNKVVRCK